MGNILCVYEKETATVGIVRGLFERGEARKAGIHARFVSLSCMSDRHADWCDVLFMIRPAHPVFSCLAERGKKAGKFVAVFCDDDLLQLPKELPGMPWRKKGLVRTLHSCDALLSSSRHILRRFRAYTAHGCQHAVMDTAVPEESIRYYAGKDHTDCRKSAVKIVYAAGIAHTDLFNQYIRPVLPQICAVYGKKISLTCMGVRPDLREFEDRIQIEYVKELPLDRYREAVADGHYDLGLALLGTDPFSRAKYFNKFIEYSMMGIVGIYSDTEPYTDIVKDGVNGFLAQNTEEGWMRAISRAVEDSAARERCRQNAYKALVSRFTPENITEKLLSAVPELELYKAPDKRTGIGKIRYVYRMSLFADYIYKIFFYAARGGVKGLCQHIANLAGIKNFYFDR